MGWFPHFLSPAAAAVAAAAAVPALLLLYFLKLRRREMPVSSTFLWRRAVQDLQVNAPFQRLRRNLLLLLQLLALLALILALARPVANYTPGAGKLSVILIDRSASMSAADGGPGGRTRLAEAKRLATDLVDGMDRGGQATVIAFDDAPEVVQTFTGDAQALRAAIAAIAPTDRRTRLKQAFQLAGAQAAHLPEQNRANVKPAVYLFSDGRTEDPPADLNLEGDLRYTPVGTDAAANLAVVALDAKRNYDNPVQVQVFARLANFGPAPVSADVRLTVDGVPRGVAGVALAPERWADPAWAAAHPGARDDAYPAKPSVQFNVDMPAAGVIRVEQMNHAGDLLPADDAAAVVVPPPKDLSVALVADTRGAPYDNPYLAKAFASMGVKDAQVLTAEQYEDRRPTNFDVVIFDRYTPAWSTWKEPPGGSFIWFGCAPPDGPLHAIRVGERTGTPADAARAGAAGTAGTLTGNPANNPAAAPAAPPADASADALLDTVADVGVLDWQRDHPILKHLQVGDLYAAVMLRLAVPPDAQVLVDGLKGPMVVLGHQGRQTHLVVAFDLLQSNWPLHRVSFPLFIHYALQYLALGSDMAVRPSYQPGATPRVPHADLDRLNPDVKVIHLTGPTGPHDLPVPAAGDFVLPALTKVGLYKTDPPVPGFEQVAVNLLDATESNLVPVTTPPGNVTTAATALAAAPQRGRLDLWWYLVAAGAVPLLLVEWWVYTRRVHL